MTQTKVDNKRGEVDKFLDSIVVIGRGEEWYNSGDEVTLIKYKYKIQPFIRKLITQTQQETLEMVKRLKRKLVDYPNGKDIDAWHYGWDDGFNQAIDDVCQTIKNKMEEL